MVNVMVNVKKKILLVDDDEIHLITAELFLRNEYEVYKAKSGHDALEYLVGGKFVPDLILLDILMPNMDGWEVLKKIKKTDSLRNVPVVLLTSVKEKKELERAYKMGVADYFTKPFNMVELRSRIKEVMNGYRLKISRLQRRDHHAA